MFIRVVSDIHTEFFAGDVASLMEWAVPYIAGEEKMVLVLAGDITTVDNMIQYTAWIKDLAQRHFAVVYVLGNHESYHGTRNQAVFYWKYIGETIKNLYVLECDTVYIDNVRFVGGSLYTPLDGPLDHLHTREMSDMGLVKDFNVGIWRKIHNQTVAYFKAELGDVETYGKTVVVTHHAPSYMSVNEKYRNSPLNCCYASNLDNLVGYSEAVLWCHGHMHDSCDYMLGDTRIICNPHGYHEVEHNMAFDGSMVVEI